MTPEDAVTVGVVDREAGGFEPIADTTAWSWQQGPLAQWVPGSRAADVERPRGDDFVARLHDVDTGGTSTLPHSVYALAPDGATALGLNMARLSRARPGYGYFGGDTRGAEVGGARRRRRVAGRPGRRVDATWCSRSPRRWRSCTRCSPRLTARQLTSAPRLYWFNHVKFSPDGRRFTVKLRWRAASLEQPWRGLRAPA